MTRQSAFEAVPARSSRFSRLSLESVSVLYWVSSLRERWRVFHRYSRSSKTSRKNNTAINQLSEGVNWCEDSFSAWSIKSERSKTTRILLNHQKHNIKCCVPPWGPGDQEQFINEHFSNNNINKSRSVYESCELEILGNIFHLLIARLFAALSTIRKTLACAALSHIVIFLWRSWTESTEARNKLLEIFLLSAFSTFSEGKIS